jgi:hypothetical protein
MSKLLLYLNISSLWHGIVVRELGVHNKGTNSSWRNSFVLKVKGPKSFSLPSTPTKHETPKKSMSFSSNIVNGVAQSNVKRSLSDTFLSKRHEEEPIQTPVVQEKLAPAPKQQSRQYSNRTLISVLLVLVVITLGYVVRL